MYGRVYTCFVQLGLSQNLGQEKQGGGGTLQNVCYPAMCIPLCGIFGHTTHSFILILNPSKWVHCPCSITTRLSENKLLARNGWEGPGHTWGHSEQMFVCSDTICKGKNGNSLFFYHRGGTFIALMGSASPETNFVWYRLTKFRLDSTTLLWILP